jgi:hypothetical protein
MRALMEKVSYALLSTQALNGTDFGGRDIQVNEDAITLCSRECLRAFAANTSGPDRSPAFGNR